MVPIDISGIEQEIEQESPEPEELPKLDRDKFLEAMTTGKDDALGDVKWVFQALGARNLTPDDAPSAGAWALLIRLQSDEVMLKSFYSTVFPKLLPSKSQLDKSDDHVDDDRKLFPLIERLLREPDDDAPVLSSTERRARELAVSRAGS